MKRLPKLLFSLAAARCAVRLRGSRSDRRGVLLLVVLSLLVLFALIGITFVLVASQSRRISRADSRGEQYGDDYRKQLDEVFAQIVRDTTNPRSVLRTHSLLNDMYGLDGLKMTYGGVAITAGTGGQFIDFNVNAATVRLIFQSDTVTPGAAIAPLASGSVTLSDGITTVTVTNLTGTTFTAGTPITAYQDPITLTWYLPESATPTPKTLTPTQLQTPGYFNGCVLTMVDGPAANLSTRIVGWGFTAPNFTVRVLAFDGFNTASLVGTTGTFLINGRPFNGTGFGFNPAAGAGAPTLLSSQSTINVPNVNVGGIPSERQVPFPSALLPNQVFAGSNPSVLPLPSIPIIPGTPWAIPQPFPTGLGGADEDYDAVDPQNMLLAFMPANPSGPAITPSLHRADTLLYLNNSPNAAGPFTAAFGGGPALNAKRLIMRQAMLRPLGAMANLFGIPPEFPPDHPNFTGSNPAFDPILGPWDVDNDGDGIADSVWVDVGFPVQSAPDGRRFKPLAAILCVDLDGRLNMNAHGNVAQAYSGYNTAIAPATGLLPPTLADFALNPIPAGAGTLPSVTLPRGTGYGPAEINLGATVGPGSIFATLLDYQKFFTGGTYVVNGTTNSYEGRYGEFGAALPLPGATGAALGADDKLELIKRFAFPVNPANPLNSLSTPADYMFNYYTGGRSNYGSPSDLWGRGVVAVDYAGQPIYSFYSYLGNIENPLGSADNEAPHDPYTLNLSHNRARSSGVTPTMGDNPFMATELEAMLRKFDIDASALPARLRNMLDPLGTSAGDLARVVTTDSFDLPSPSGLTTRDVQVRIAAINTALAAQVVPLPPLPTTNLHIVDLMRAKMLEGRMTPGPPPTFAPPITALMMQTINSQIATMLPPELIAGQRFDLNRPFGNGADDDGNGVVDEPTAAEYGAHGEAPDSWLKAYGAAVQFDLNNDGTPADTTAGTFNDLFARQQYAKHLYILMMLLTDQTYAWTQEAGLTLVQKKELTARRIAQWAVNVVDFRDPDSIMTPFEYDVDPFNADGWSVDGILGSADDTTATDRRLVWGCEYPELLLTETLAFHDRRVKDDANPNKINSMTPDPDMDQKRIPQGSVFFELYCPRKNNTSPGATAYSRDLYTAGGQLNLSAITSSGAAQFPVWRIAITASTTSAANNVGTRVNNNPDSANLDPVDGTADSLHGSLFDPSNAAGALTIDRYIWLGGDPTGNTDIGRIYSNVNTGTTLLTPGQYAVVGPRDKTYLGLTTAGGLAPQSILLDTVSGKVTYTDVNGTSPPANTALPIICMSSSMPTGWTVASVGDPPIKVGMSISEPLFSGAYYSQPMTPGPDPAVKDTYTPEIDTPLDTTGPLGVDGLLKTGIKPNYKFALLQRLANPLAVYDATINPYITVDWQPINLVVFNGEEPNLPTPLPDPQDPPPLPPNLMAGSCERGPVAAALWNVLPQKIPTVNSVLGSAVFPFQLQNTLGTLNAALGTPWTPAGAQAGYAGVPTPPTAPPPPGPPPVVTTFPWITWNNRPFTSNMELLLVPDTSAEQLVRQFSTVTASNPYDLNANAVSGGTTSPFRHLLNFLSTADGLASTAAAPKAPYFYRLLDYVHVPSRFAGTETWLNPANFSAALPTAPVEQSLASFFHPPFNKVSNYRDPGRVNINTVAIDAATGNSAAWLGILNSSPGPAWATIFASRVNGAGYGTSPSLMANPFRSAGGAAYTLPGSPPLASEVSATLMRPDLTAPTQPLFGFLGNPAQPYTDPDRNPYFRYQTLERLSNVLTTRSNVYAIWITVGYFEVTQAPLSLAGGTAPDYTIYPDGYQLGQELGSDMGDVKRHRAFYIYDRSIPVGFEPGRDHNFDKGVLLKRFIE